MKPRLILLFGVCILLAVSCTQQVSVPPESHPDSSSWDDLFASDLSNAAYSDTVWTFEDGVLTAAHDQNIWTEQMYDNFILDLEFKNADNTNSGVIVYCNDRDNWIPNSVEIQIADDYSDQWSEAPGTWQCGAIFGHLAPTHSAVKPPGEWNRYTITCKDQMIWVMLNGDMVTEMDMSLWTSGTQNPDGSEIPSWLSTPFAQLPTKGYIGLQGKHADASIWFRNLKIKVID